MNINQMSQTGKLDLVTSLVLAACIFTVVAALELSASILAGVGAGVAATTSVARLVYTFKKRP